MGVAEALTARRDPDFGSGPRRRGGSPGKRRADSVEYAFARLSRFYGFDCFDLPPARLFALDAALPGLQAEDLLRERGHELPIDALQETVFEATGDADLAELVARKRAAAILRAGATPE